ncbi:SGNH/GDSL hydrolase family protein [Oceanispirochaeta crateris]|nr:GDSL-type esterase/lipase family protein [Oceanispirochaeta crateris]
MTNFRRIIFFYLTSILSVSGISASTAKASAIKIACIGDSLTYGYGLFFRGVNSYPAQLEKLLPPGFEVMNFGINGACAVESSEDYYLNQPYDQILNWNPDILVVMLGSNDSKEENWTSTEAYIQGLNNIIKTLSSQGASVVVMTPPPSGINLFGIDDGKVRSAIIPALVSYTSQKGYPLLNIYDVFSMEENIFIDNIHLNRESYLRISKILSHQLETIVLKHNS